MKQHNRRLDVVLALALAAFFILPWYRIEQGFFRFSWLEGFFSQAENGPGILQIFAYGRPWLAVVAVLMLICGFARFVMSPEKRTSVLIGASLLGAGFLALQGLAIGFTGWNWTVSETLFGQLADGQPAFGAGAVLTGLCFLLIFSFRTRSDERRCLCRFLHHIAGRTGQRFCILSDLQHVCRLCSGL